MTLRDRLHAWIKAGLTDPQAGQSNAMTARAIALEGTLGRLLSSIGRDDMNDSTWSLPMDDRYLQLIPLIDHLLKRIASLEERVDDEAYKTTKHEIELFGK